MPSIPQSLLWISLVVLWLFVLVPMLVSKRDAVRRTSDVALATRVLNSDTAARLLRRSGPAAGHRSDPEWQPEQDHDDDAEEHDVTPSRSVVVQSETAEASEPDYLDVDIVEDETETPALEPAEAGADSAAPDDEADVEAAEAGWEADDDEYGDEGEYDEADAEFEADEDAPETVRPMTASGASRRRRYDSQAAAVSARKYNFRKKTLMVMAVVLIVSATMAFTVTSAAWWLCAGTATVTVFYLGYLRRQTHIEQQVRRRRMQRMARSRRMANVSDGGRVDVDPSQSSRPGVAVLDIDDEDPAFEHLEYMAYAREYNWRGDLPRAAGQ